jgi:hypothetical protein
VVDKVRNLFLDNLLLLCIASDFVDPKHVFPCLMYIIQTIFEGVLLMMIALTRLLFQSLNLKKAAMNCSRVGERQTHTIITRAWRRTRIVLSNIPSVGSLDVDRVGLLL